MIKDNSFVNILDQISAPTPTPGGGSCCAMMASIAISLLEMVINLTLKKDSYKAFHDELKIKKESILSIKTSMINLIEEDTLAYNQVIKAISLPKENNEQIIYRKESLQEAYKESIKSPLKMIYLISEITLIITDLTPKINKNTMSDIGVALLALKASSQGASLNVLINLKMVKDEQYKIKINEEMNSFLETTNKKIELIEREMNN